MKYWKSLPLQAYANGSGMDATIWCFLMRQVYVLCKIVCLWKCMFMKIYEDGNRNLKQKFWGFDSGVIVHKIKLSTDDFVIEII